MKLICTSVGASVGAYIAWHFFAAFWGLFAVLLLFAVIGKVEV
jgi:thiosulfate reductase cytochrome b subunit